MKKLFVSAFAAVMAIVATPALAGPTLTPRVELRAGVEDVVNGIGGNFAIVKNNVSYGAAAGVDAEFDNGIVVGAEVSTDNLFSDNRDIGVAGRLGYKVTPSVLAYGKLGYANYRNAFKNDFDGLRAGAGLEVSVLDPLYIGAEYQYSDFEKGQGKHGVFAKVGLKF